MYSYQSQQHYNIYGHEQCPSYHEKHPNNLHRPAMAFEAPIVPQSTTEAPCPVIEGPPATKKKRKIEVKKPVSRLVVDTSAFSVEERLVAAVWVHERKHTKISMSQIKKDFLQRFGREPPAKNTLLVWERKIFSSGSIHDAPRPGRPVNRRSRMEEVSASLRAAPSLSLRARAAALHLPRTTLNTILQRDLRHIPQHNNRSPKKTSKKSKTLPRPASAQLQCVAAQPYQHHGY